MAKKGITGTDVDLVGNLPISPDAQVRGTEIENLIKAIDVVTITDPAVLAFVKSFRAQAQHVGSTTSEVGVDGPDAEVSQNTDADEGATTDASGDVEGAGERLDERLTTCLEQLRGDFDRGIVKIDEEATLEDYTKAFKADKTAGQKWETLEVRLRANGADLLKKAAAMPEGACLIGVHADGTLAIRQRSREIVNVVITEEGQSVLLPHTEAVQHVQTQGGRYAKAVEIVRGVEANGYRVPADSPNYEKKGLVAASDAVMGGNYVESPVTKNPQDREWRSAMLKCPDNTLDSAFVRVVSFDPGYQRAGVNLGAASYRGDDRGAVLWLRG